MKITTRYEKPISNSFYKLLSYTLIIIQTQKYGMLKQIVLLFLFCFSCSIVNYAQTTQKEQINWISFQAALDLQKESKKPLMVFVYTDWCKFCKMMEADVFKNQKAVKYLNEHFLNVRLNAENKDSLVVSGQTYKYLPEYRSHELALHLLNGKMSYPTTVFITADQQIQRIPSYLDLLHAEWLYVFFGEKKYMQTSFDEFMQSHKPVW